MIMADTWSRGRDRWQLGQSCHRSPKSLGTGSPQTQVWLVLRGFTATVTRPASAALAVRIAMNCAHAASEIDLAREWFWTMFLTARLSWQMVSYACTRRLAVLWWKSRR